MKLVFHSTNNDRLFDKVFSGEAVTVRNQELEEDMSTLT